MYAPRRWIWKLRHIGLWNLIALGQVVFITIDGASYFVKGNEAAAGPSFAVLHSLPGGLHTYGAMMLSLAFFIVASIRDHDGLGRKVQFGVFIFALWVSVEVVAGWVVSDDFAVGIFTKWFFVAWSGFALWVTHGSHKKKR